MLFSALLALVALGACDAFGGNESLPGTVVNVTEDSFTITTDRGSASRGTLTFHVTNVANEQHTFVVIRTDRSADDLPLAMDKSVAMDKLDVVDQLAEVPRSGEPRDLTVDLEPGHYVLLCRLDHHYQHGMRLDFSVTGAAGPSGSMEEPSSSP